MAEQTNPLPNLPSNVMTDGGVDITPFTITSPIGGPLAGKPGDDTNAIKKNRAATVARNKLKKKNRKHKKHNFVIPFNPVIESGTVYTLTGFSPDFDGNWLITKVEHTLTGKAGSKTSVDMEKSITSY